MLLGEALAERAGKKKQLEQRQRTEDRGQGAECSFNFRVVPVLP